MTKNFNVALIGNPNCGKTTLFNKLTGSNQYVGNWPGVTVEKKVGRLKNSQENVQIIDLPGIYSLSPYSQEEIVSRDCLLDDQPDLILNIIDATNLQRNLYLTTQLLELGCPIIVAVNMVDVLKKNGDILDFTLFQKQIGVPVIPICASKGSGLEKLLLYIKNAHKKNLNRQPLVMYNDTLEKVLLNIDALVHQKLKQRKFLDDRFFSIRIFENDESIINKLQFNQTEISQLTKYKENIKTSENFDHQMIIADQRYNFICKICSLALNKKNKTLTFSDKVDRFVTNKYLAIPIFICIMLCIFSVTFGSFGNSLRSLTQNFIEKDVGLHVSNLLINWGASQWSHSLVVDGVISGVGAVISFVPQICILFFFLCLLEDSGYMARGAFIMDHFLRKLGLSGKAFVPLLLGFGCTVSAVLGARTLENDRDRRLVIMISPFMSCSAKMPVYALFVSTFFKGYQPLIILSIYLLGIVVAVASALLLKGSVLKGQDPPFIMEMPAYHLPVFKNLSLHVFERVKDFVMKAGTILLGATILIWFLQSFNLSLQMVHDSSDSILSNIGSLIAPVFSLCGFGDWKASVSLLTGIIAKESVVSTLTVLSGGSLLLKSNLTSLFTPLSAYSFMTFVLLYTPCIAALSAIKKELKSFKLMFISVIYQLTVAWTVSALIFQIGSGVRLDFFIGFVAICVVLFTILKTVKSFKKGKCISCNKNCNMCK